MGKALLDVRIEQGDDGRAKLRILSSSVTKDSYLTVQRALAELKKNLRIAYVEVI